ncbi:hypothetical protein BDN70DRAFT_887645, partial [Pholiota conissans]
MTYRGAKKSASRVAPSDCSTVDTDPSWNFEVGLEGNQVGIVRRGRHKYSKYEQDVLDMIVRTEKEALGTSGVWAMEVTIL